MSRNDDRIEELERELEKTRFVVKEVWSKLVEVEAEELLYLGSEASGFAGTPIG